MKSKNKKSGFIEGIIILFISQILTKVFGFVYTVFLINKEGFGDSGNAIYLGGYQVYALFLTLSSIGVPSAISKMISEKIAIGDIKNANKIFKTSLLIFSMIGLISSSILYLFSHKIATVLLQIPESEIVLKLLSPAIFFVSIASVFKGYFNGLQNMEVTAKSQIIEQIGKAIFTIIIVELIAKMSGYSTKYMAAGATIATTIATFLGFFYSCIYYILCKNKIKSNGVIVKKYLNNIEKNSKILKNIFKVSIPIALSSIMGSLTKNVDSITVIRELKKYMSISDAKIQYGILTGKIETLISLPLSFNLVFATTLIPCISSANVIGNYREIKKKIRFAIIIGIIFSVPYIILMNVFSKQILQLIFPNANGGVEVLRISSLSIIFVVLSQTINGALQGLGKQFIPAKAYGFGIIAKIICNLTLIKMPFLGIKGAAIGTVLCNAIACIYSYIHLKKEINFKKIHKLDKK